MRRICSECNPEREGEVGHANKGKAGAPYRYLETLIMPVGKRHRLNGAEA